MLACRRDVKRGGDPELGIGFEHAVRLRAGWHESDLAGCGCDDDDDERSADDHDTDQAGGFGWADVAYPKFGDLRELDALLCSDEGVGFDRSDFEDSETSVLEMGLDGVPDAH